MKASARALAVVSVAYFSLLIVLAQHLSLWLDEVLQLIGTRGHSAAEILQYLKFNPGAAPLGYLTQAALVNGFGFSLLTARFSALLSSTLAFLAIWLVARQCSQAPLLPVWLLMVLPLSFRYALEARPYSQALLFSVLSTALFLALLKRPTVLVTLAYTACVTAGLYSQPFSVFVPMAHLLWIVLLALGSPTLRRVRNATMAALGTAALLFVPWFLFTRADWKAQLDPMTSGGEGFHFAATTPLMLFREISGASYWGSTLLIAFACLGLVSPLIGKRFRVLAGLTIAVPVLGTLLADAVFDYFLAVRQIIFILPGMVILAGFGLEWIYRSNRSLAVAGFVCLSAVSVWYDVGWFRRPREDWNAAAKLLLAQTDTACLVPLPEKTFRVYEFFEPDLVTRLCPQEVHGTAAVLAIPPSSSRENRASAIRKLTDAGWRANFQELSAGQTTAIRFSGR